MVSVAVIGCGPAGLLAAHAVRLHGFEARIFAPNPRPSHISGAQYLHSPIVELTREAPDGKVTYEKHGTREGYANKIYGSPDAPCSWDLFDGEVEIWALRPRYKQLWDLYKEVIADRRIEGAQHIKGLLHFFDGVICTAPRWQFQEGHARQEHVWISDYPLGREGIPEMTIEYMGLPEVPWYRASNIFGHVSVEWPEVSFHPHEARHITKPLSFEPSEKLPPQIIFAGRYGEWRKGVLVDDAFDVSMEFCEKIA